MTTAQLNDEFRSNPGKFSKNKVVMSLSVSALDPVDIASLMQQVSTFSEFSEDNDPFDEHDFGAVDFVNTKYFWKIDYYDADLEYGSVDPANNDITTRVLTVMEANEY
jgi:hypothetical protein